MPCGRLSGSLRLRPWKARNDDVARYKAAKNCSILPWLSAKSDCREGRFLQIGGSLFFNERFQGLSAGAKILYFAMALESGGKRSFVFPLTAAKKYGVPASSFRRYVGELAQGGFVEVHSNANLRRPNDYYFSLAWKEKPP